VTNTAGCEAGGSWESYSNTKSWTLAQTNATATVYVKFKDRSKNVSSCQSDTIIHDSILPTITSFVRNPSYGLGNDATPDFDFGGAGTVARAYLFSNGTCSGAPVSTLNSVASDAGTITGTSLSSNGAKTYSLQLEDAAGNLSLCSSSVDYTFYSNAWLATTTTSAPSARVWETAIWTGTKMVIWGGYGNGGETNTGGQYDPVTDSWTTTSTGANVPTARGQVNSF